MDMTLSLPFGAPWLSWLFATPPSEGNQGGSLDEATGDDILSGEIDDGEEESGDPSKKEEESEEDEPEEDEPDEEEEDDDKESSAIHQKKKWREKALKSQQEVKELTERLEALEKAQKEGKKGEKKTLRELLRDELKSLEEEERKAEADVKAAFENELEEVLDEQSTFSEKQIRDLATELSVSPRVALKALKKTTKPPAKKPKAPKPTGSPAGKKPQDSGSDKKPRSISEIGRSLRDAIRKGEL